MSKIEAPVITHVERKGLMAKIEGEPHKWHAGLRFAGRDGSQHNIRVASHDVFILSRLWSQDVDRFARKFPDVFAEWQQSSPLK